MGSRGGVCEGAARRQPRRSSRLSVCELMEPGGTAVVPGMKMHRRMLAAKWRASVERAEPRLGSPSGDAASWWRASGRFRILVEQELEGERCPRPRPQPCVLQEYVLQEITKAAFTEPTPIRSQGWPMALKGRDLIDIAETRFGKTLAYLLPAITHVNAQPILAPGDGPIVLVLAPTRELVVHIQQETTKFGASSKIKSTCIYGGVPKSPQVLKLLQPRQED